MSKGRDEIKLNLKIQKNLKRCQFYESRINDAHTGWFYNN